MQWLRGKRWSLSGPVNHRLCIPMAPEVGIHAYPEACLRARFTESHTVTSLMPTLSRRAATSRTCCGANKKIEWTSSFDGRSQRPTWTVAIYDTDCAHVYVNDENEVAYEPLMLKLFRPLVDACENADRLIAEEIATKVSSKASITCRLRKTGVRVWFQAVTRLTAKEETDSRCSWSEQLDHDLANLGQRLAEANPGDRAMTLRKTKSRPPPSLSCEAFSAVDR